MRSGFLIALAFVAALFVAAACRRDEPESQKTPRLVSVAVSETALELTVKGSAELHFRVAEADYAFNYSVDSPECLVRLSGKDGKVPSEFRISRIVPGTEKGLYTATLTDLGLDEDYT